MNDINDQVGFRDVQIAGLPIATNIDRLTIREWVFDFIPTIAISLKVEDLFSKMWTLQENDEIKVTISGKSQDKRDVPVNVRFQLKGWDITQIDNGDQMIMKVVGALQVANYFVPLKRRSFKEKSSVDVLAELGEEMGLGVDVRVDSDDKQTWIQHTSNSEFIQHLLINSYISDDDTLFAYVDLDKNMVITSLKTEAKRQGTSKNFAYLPEAFADDYDSERATADTKIYPFIGINHKNVTSIFNMMEGYGSGYTQYDYNSIKQDIIKPNVNFLNTNGGIDKNLVGSVAKWTEVIQPPSAHKNFATAKLRNSFIKKSAFTSPQTIMSNSYKSVKMMDKINVALSVVKNDADRDSLDSVLAGEFLLGGKTYYLEPPFTLKEYITLFRQGLGEGQAMSDEDFTQQKRGE